MTLLSYSYSLKSFQREHLSKTNEYLFQEPFVFIYINIDAGAQTVSRLLMSRKIDVQTVARYRNNQHKICEISCVVKQAYVVPWLCVVAAAYCSGKICRQGPMCLSTLENYR